MTADQLLQRDMRISELEGLGRDRSAAEQDELLFLIDARDAAWKRLAGRVISHRRKAAELAAYARQIGLPLEEAA